VLKKSPRRRKPGRPTAVAAAGLSVEAIIEHALDMAKRLPVEEISVVSVARELGVAAALIHYYVRGGRDALTSGIINAFYRRLLADWPATAGDWRTDLATTSRYIFLTFTRYPGVASYVGSRNRFRIFQDVGEGEDDYGALAVERFISVVRAAPVTDDRVGVYAHLLLEFLVSSAYGTTRNRWPGQQPNFINQKVAELDPKAFPNLHMTASSLVSLDGQKALDEVLLLFINGLEAAHRG
jgi:AcrR family transcriptional regulator